MVQKKPEVGDYVMVKPKGWRWKNGWFESHAFKPGKLYFIIKVFADTGIRPAFVIEKDEFGESSSWHYNDTQFKLIPGSKLGKLLYE